MNKEEINVGLNLGYWVLGFQTQEGGDGLRASLLSDSVVPDDVARLVAARMCVYTDAAGRRVLNEISTDRIRFVHPHVKERQCVMMGVPKLSDLVVEVGGGTVFFSLLVFVGNGCSFLCLPFHSLFCDHIL